MTAIFFAMERRSTAYWVVFRERCCRLEEQLAFDQWRRSPPKTVFSATNGVYALFGGIAVFWAGVALANGAA